MNQLANLIQAAAIVADDWLTQEGVNGKLIDGLALAVVDYRRQQPQSLDALISTLLAMRAQVAPQPTAPRERQVPTLYIANTRIAELIKVMRDIPEMNERKLQLSPSIANDIVLALAELQRRRAVTQ